jgi:hypothetical protein
MKAIMVLFAVGLFILFLGVAIMPALSNFRGLDVTAPYNVALTGSDNTTATIVLANEVLDDNKVNVEITSPDVDDAPVAFDYVAVTKRLTVTGLAPDTTRQLSVVYKVPRLDGATDMAARFTPTVLIIAGIAIVGGSVYSGVQEARGRG